jgi:hypothetical protein
MVMFPNNRGTRVSYLSIGCPHCEAAASTRTSRKVTALVREVYMQCNNLNCGHTFVAQLSVVRTIAPSNIPRPGLVLPIAPPRRKARSGEFNAANDDAPINGSGALEA